MYAVSLWLVVDLQTIEGRSLAYAAVKRLVYTHTCNIIQIIAWYFNIISKSIPLEG